MIYFLKGVLLGGLIVLGFVLVLAMFSRLVLAHEQVQINEFQRPVEVKYHGHNEALTDMMLIHTTPSGMTHFQGTTSETVERWCHDSNEFVAALKANLDEHARANPELADVYAPAYESIEEAWCNE